jgi:hypothetical protein
MRSIVRFAKSRQAVYVAYGAAAWISVALVGYGLALERYYARVRSDAGFVIRQRIESRSSWTFGYFGGLSFRLLGGEGYDRFFIGPDYYVPAKDQPRSLYWVLEPGVEVMMKGNGGFVAELTVNPGQAGAVTYIHYGETIPKVVRDLKAAGGKAQIFLGALIVPALFAFRRFRAYRLRQRQTSK